MKPDNILINKLSNGDEILSIGDFGISKKDLGNIRITQTLQDFTTPVYMAPESINE